MTFAFLFVKGYLFTLLFLIYIYIALAESWNILGGYAGQICLGAGAFFGTGAYAFALCLLDGLPFILCLIIGGIAALGLAVILIPMFKLRGIYFSMGSLFLPEILKSLVLNLKSVTRGASGLILPINSATHTAYCYFISLFIAVGVTFISYMISKSRIRLAFEAVREDENAAASLGVNIVKFKIIALLLTSFFCGMAGGIYAYQMVYIEPYGVFELSWSVTPVFMSVIGGVGSIIGPLVGASIYLFLSQAIATSIGEMNLLVLGLLLIIVMLFTPQGVTGALRNIYKKYFVTERGESKS